MDNQTLEALQGSIKKWEAILAGTAEDEGAGDCPLCHMFYQKSEEDDYSGRHEDVDNSSCRGCPVKLKTGHAECRETPYRNWLSVVYEQKLKDHTHPVRVAAAQAMLGFLKALLLENGNVENP